MLFYDYCNLCICLKFPRIEWLIAMLVPQGRCLQYMYFLVIVILLAAILLCFSVVTRYAPVISIGRILMCFFCERVSICYGVTVRPV